MPVDTAGSQAPQLMCCTTGILLIIYGGSRDYWISCLINPSVGREAQWGGDRLHPAEHPKSVLVVGGGPAGLEAARVAAECGHRVILAEASDCLTLTIRASPCRSPVIAGASPRNGIDNDALKPAREMDQIRNFLSGMGPTALLDLLWMPVYDVICFLLHPLIGLHTGRLNHRRSCALTPRRSIWR